MRYAECIECGKKEPRSHGVLVGTRCYGCRQKKRSRDSMMGICEKCGGTCATNAARCMGCRIGHGKRRRKAPARSVRMERQPEAEAARALRVIDRDAVLAAMKSAKTPILYG